MALGLVGACVATSWPGDSPVVPRHAGHPAGNGTWAWLFFAAELGAFAAYVGGLLLLRRRVARLMPIAVIAAAIQLAPLGARLLLSTDAWTYWDYGRIAAVDGGNPYRNSPSDFPADPAYPHVGSAWRRTTSVYGPGFTLVSEPIGRAAGSSPDAAAWIYKALAAAAMLAATALAGLLAPRKSFAVAFVGWNPLLAIHFAGGGHNDVWMAVLVLAALALGGSGRRQLAGAAWAGAILIKWSALVFLPLRALEARARGRRVGHLGFAVAALATAALATWRYGWHWLNAFGPVARNANHETGFALPHRLEQLGVPRVLGIALFAVGFLAAYAWLAREALRGRARLGLAAGLLLCATPYLAAWYTVWAVPLAAVDDDPPAQWLAVVLSAYLLRQTVPL